LKPFKKTLIYLVLVLTILIPIFPSTELLGKQNEEKIKLIENIKNKEQAEKEIEKLIKLIENAEENKKYNKAISYLQKVLKIEKKLFGDENLDVADTYYWIGELYAKLNIFEKAKQFLSKATEIYEREEGRTSINVSNSLFWIGWLYQENYQYEKARNYYEEALIIKEQILGKDHIDLSVLLTYLGEVNAELFLFEKAEINYLRALKIREKIKGINDPFNSSILNNLGFVNKEKGNYKNAEEYYLRAQEITAKAYGSDHIKNITTLNNIASNYEAQALFEKAEEYYLRVLEITTKNFDPDHIENATILNNLGLFYLEKNFYEKAEIFLKRSLNIYENIYGSNHHLTANALNSMGGLFLEKGLLNKSEDFFLKSLSIKEKIFNDKHPTISVTLNSLGGIYFDQGNFQKSEEVYKRALKIDEQYLGPEHPDTSITINNLALLYDHQERYEEAEFLYLRSLRIKEKVFGEDHPYTVSALANLGPIYIEQKQFKKAENVLKKALVIDKKTYGINSPNVAIRKNNLGFFYFDQKIYKKAEPFFKDALNINLRVLGPYHQSTVNSYDALAFFYEDQNLFDKSYIYRKKALDLNLNFIKRELPFLPINRRKQFLQKQNIFDDRIYSYILNAEKGLDIALFARLNYQGILAEIEKKQAKISNLSGQQKLVLEKIKKITQIISSKDIDFANREKLMKEKEILEKNFYSLISEIKPKVISIAEVAKAIPKKSILIEFIRYSPYESSKISSQRFGKERYLALTLTNDKEIEAIDLGSAEIIDNKINKALTASELVLSDSIELWKEVGEFVLKPLLRIIDTKENIFISPDSALNKVPFNAITSFNNSDGIEKSLNLLLLTTGRDLIELTEKSNQINNKSLIVANPDFNQKEITYRKDSSLSKKNINTQKRSGEFKLLSWNALPGTSKEGQIISKITNGELLEKDKATSLAIQQKISPKILHIASHAYFMPDKKGLENPLLRSGIVLAGANQPNLNPNDDGYLLALEVAKLEWQGTEMAVISGCESGRGDIQSGEGVYGLKRAIAVAGARSSLLSLWKVDDNATAAFMESFYKKLINKKGRADALAATQKEFKIHPIKAWRHPNVWAAFQLSGDWRAIKF